MANVEYWDLEDYLEEVKFLMTEYEVLTENVILDWEKKRLCFDVKFSLKNVNYEKMQH